MSAIAHSSSRIEFRSSNYRTRERGDEPSFEGPSGEVPGEGPDDEETTDDKPTAEETTRERPTVEAVIDLGDGCGRRKRWGDV
jgi:hypothetical protein